MSTESPTAEPFRGYVSEASKRRFTLIAGLLGALFFLAQFALPLLLMFLVMMPTMFRQAVSIDDVDRAALWRDELWLVGRTINMNPLDIEHSTTSFSLSRRRVSDLSVSGPVLPLGTAGEEAHLELLPSGDRLWLLDGDRISYYAGGTVTRLQDATRPRRATRAFTLEGRPAVISLGTPARLATLNVDGARAEWTARDLSLDLPSEAGALSSLQAVEAGASLYLVAELCTEEPQHCTLRYRKGDEGPWTPVPDDACSCSQWTLLALGAAPAIVCLERQQGREAELAVFTIASDGPRAQRLELAGERWGLRRWRALPQGDRLFLVSEGMPGNLRLTEVANGRAVRTAEKRGSFPFAENMMWFMFVPQLLPVLLSLLLALVLTWQMRRHRVQHYVFAETRREFASLWQRALAQLVDLVPLAAGFALPGFFMWRLFSDPESVIERGPMFPLWILGLFAAAALCGLLVLVVYSYLEGRFGKTPGKWLLRIRVLGTDLQPCGFGRALLRNLLTFVDGFFNFLVGVLLVALTENWQRLGDLAARTVVLADGRGRGEAAR